METHWNTSVDVTLLVMLVVMLDVMLVVMLDVILVIITSDSVILFGISLSSDVLGVLAGSGTCNHRLLYLYKKILGDLA